MVNATPICHSSYWVEYWNKKGQSPPSSGDSTNMAEPALLLETMSDLPLIVPQTPHLLMNPEGEPNPLIQQVHLHLAAWRVSGQASPREAFLRQLISASWRPGTEKAYNSVWKQWRSWCEGRSTSVFPTSVVEFIAQKQYSTLNLYRSALSATIPPKEGHPVGQRPLVCRALQGSFSQRPPMPKCTSTWDVNTVVLYLKEKMGDTPTLNLKALSQKLVVLLALSNASDLVALDVRFVQSSEEGVAFRIPGLTKMRRSGPPRSFEVSRFKDASLCPVKTLEYYIRQTKDIRKEGGNGSYRLFISVRKPHNAVTSATIGRWIKQILSMVGVNTDQFSAHSTRSASTTAAKKQGVSVRDIMGTAGWSRQSTFETFYHTQGSC